MNRKTDEPLKNTQPVPAGENTDEKGRKKGLEVVWDVLNEGNEVMVQKSVMTSRVV